MTIRAEVRLFAPTYRQWMGGVNPSLSSKTTRIEITPMVLETLLKNRRVSISGISFHIAEDYNAVNNTIALYGSLHDHKDTEKILQEMRALAAKGWEFDKELCARYELKFW